MRQTALKWLACGALALLASPLAAYTIYLKNGQTIQAKGKPRIENGKAYIVLNNGTQSFLDAKEIDLARTEAANKSDYGGNAVILDPGTTPPPDAPVSAQQSKRLSEMIANREAARDLPGPSRTTSLPTTSGSVVKTKAGYPDLVSLARRPFAQQDVANEIVQFYQSQGIEGVQVSTGTAKDRPMVEVPTASENVVFRALGVSANALLHLRDRFPNSKVPALELLMMTPQKERAGQFVLTPEMAADLVAKKIELAAFYMQNVQF